MLQGRFGNTSGRPYFEGRISIPQFEIVGDVSFLMDTGADTTVLMPVDSGRLGIDFNQLATTTDSLGIGGLSKQYLEPVILAFTDPGVCLHVYDFSILIAAATPHNKNIPSLLGRNILDRWAITYDKLNTGLTAEVIQSDMQFPL